MTIRQSIVGIPLLAPIFLHTEQVVFFLKFNLGSKMAIRALDKSITKTQRKEEKSWKSYSAISIYLAFLLGQSLEIYSFTPDTAIQMKPVLCQ